MLLLFETIAIDYYIDEPFRFFTACDIEVGKDALIFKSTKTVSFFPIEGKVISFDGTSLHFQLYDKIGKGLDKEIVLKMNNPASFKFHYGYHSDPNDLRSHYIVDYSVVLRPIEYLFETEDYGGMQVFEDLYEHYPEVLKKGLPTLLEKGNSTIRKEIYDQGLFGVSQDSWRTFAAAIHADDYEEFLRWKNLPEVANDLALMGEYKEGGVMDFKQEAIYWCSRYLKDHNDNEWFKKMLHYAEWTINFFMPNGPYYCYFLAVRDIVKAIVKENRYDEYDQNVIKYTHSTWMNDAIPLWMLCALYIEMYNNKDNGYKFVSIVEDDDLSLQKNKNEKFMENTQHFNREKMMVLLYETHYKEDHECYEEAKAIVEHYNIDKIR